MLMATGRLNRNKTLAGGSGCLTGDFDGHGAFDEKGQDSGWEGHGVQPVVLMVMGPMKRNKTLAGRVRMSNRGF